MIHVKSNTIFLCLLLTLNQPLFLIVALQEYIDELKLTFCKKTELTYRFTLLSNTISLEPNRESEHISFRGSHKQPSKHLDDLDEEDEDDDEDKDDHDDESQASSARPAMMDHLTGRAAC